MIVDVHAHCYPDSYMKELKRIGAGDEGGIGIKIPEWSSTEERIERMDALGIDIQVLSLSAPNVYFPDDQLSKSLAQMTNDFISDICKKYPDHFLSFASVPLGNLRDAIDEMKRAINDLSMDGIVLGTNVNGRSIGENQFLPFFEELDRIRVPVAIHPMRAIGEDLMPPEDVRLAIPSNVGFLFETTRTIAQMTFKGTFERYKNLIFILPHSGGAIPFVYPRWEISYRSRPASHPLRKIQNPPGHYLRKHYYDTALTYYPSSLRCTIDLAGIDHILFGTDAPYTLYDFRAKETIEKIIDSYLTEEEKEKIFYKNALNLFPKIKKKIQMSAAGRSGYLY